MYADRLLRLAEYLDTVPEDVFSIDSWKCGTTACAMGWACSIPEFQALGLRMQVNDPISGLPDSGVPTIDGRTGFAAAQELFDIPLEDATFMFAREGYYSANPEVDEVDITPGVVAERIREYVGK